MKLSVIISVLAIVINFATILYPYRNNFLPEKQEENKEQNYAVVYMPDGEKRCGKADLKGIEGTDYTLIEMDGTVYEVHRSHFDKYPL